MAYPLNPNDIVEVTYRGTCFGQVVMNVFHYQCKMPVSNPNGDLMMANLLASMAVAGGLRDKLLACNTPDYLMSEQRAQVVWPTRQIYHSEGLANPGTNPGAALTANTSAVVLKVPDQAGRGRVGMVHIIAVPSANMASGAWDLIYRVILDAFGATLPVFQSFLLPGDAKPVIWSRVKPTTPSGIISSRINPYVRVEHRRTVGVGQ